MRLSRVSREERPIILSNLSLAKVEEVGPDSDPSKFKLASDFHGVPPNANNSSQQRVGNKTKGKRALWGGKKLSSNVNSTDSSPFGRKK